MRFYFGKEAMSSLISPYEFTEVTRQLRSFFDERGFQEVHTQNRLSILAACEDPTTVATYEYSGQICQLFFICPQSIPLVKGYADDTETAGLEQPVSEQHPPIR